MGLAPDRGDTESMTAAAACASTVDELIDGARLATVGKLTAGAAHEINNPLFAILALVEFLLKDAEPGTKSHDRLLLIQETGGEIKEIVKALLDFTRATDGPPAPLSVRETVASAATLVRLTTAGEFELVEEYADDATVVGSAARIKQAVVAMLVSARSVYDRIDVRVSVDGPWVEIAVPNSAHDSATAAIAELHRGELRDGVLRLPVERA